MCVTAQYSSFTDVEKTIGGTTTDTVLQGTRPCVNPDSAQVPAPEQSDHEITGDSIEQMCIGEHPSS